MSVSPTKTPPPRKLDADLEEYRNLLQPPAEYEEGFTWISVAGAIFCGLLMFPGAIYLGLLAGVGMNAAATWVTVIVFSEIMRRAMKAMKKGEMIILLSVAGAMIGGTALIPGGPFGQLIWRQYLVTSDAVKDAGMYGKFPTWFAPAPDSAAIVSRSFMHSDWAIPVALLLFMTVIGFIQTWTLGYGLFRLTSDVEKLPFPMAPVGAQGVMALAEGEKEEKSWRWTVFSVGTVLGLVFGVVSVAVPTISSAILAKPIFILPLPWFEWTPLTEGVLPATPTGLILDLGLLISGFVMPFWAVMGTAFAVFLTLVLNPILYKAGILTQWQPGMDTIATSVSNSVDFYFSAGLGVALGVALVSIFQTVMQLRATLRERRNAAQAGTAAAGSLWDTPPGRGDWSLRLCFVGYILAAGAVVAVSAWLVPAFRQPFTFAWLAIFAFLYTPLVSYLNARILGMAGQFVEIPFVREGFILLSGARGLEVWLAPIPVDNFGYMAQGLRTTELTGVRFTSGVKAWMLTTPLLFVLSFAFWSFLWSDGPIPSEMYPYAQKMWDLQAKSTMILWSATTGAEGSVSLFERSWHPEFLAGGCLFAVLVFVLGSLVGLPTMVLYGIARGIGQLPHGIALELLGALLARFWLQRRFGKKNFLLAAPILLAGYFVGTGLIGMACVAIRLIASAITMAPF